MAEFIKRDALKDFYCKSCPVGGDKCMGEGCKVYEARRLISKIPSVIEAEPVRHGRWIEKERYNLHGDEYCDCFCSECCHRISRPYGFYPDYCEDCGARMDGGAENG